MEKGFMVNGIEYIETEKGYFYKVKAGKKSRIKKAEYEQAFDELCEQTNEQMDAEESGLNEQVDQWMDEIEAEMKKRAEEQAASDKEAEDAVNKKAGTKKASKPRKSKDIAYEYKVAGGTFLTLTAKQVAFIKAMPNDDFYEHGLDSALWVDCFCDTVADIFNPMAVGAMVSTLREKGVIVVGQDKVNGKKCKFMQFTEFGKEIAKELGLE